MANPFAKRGPAGPVYSNPRANRAPTTRKFTNPLKEWREKRKAEQKALEEQAVQKITNKIEDNALKLIDELNAVDFIHSDLPEYVKNDRQKEETAPHICNLEWDARSLVQLIRNDRQSINMDIRAIDERLMTLVLMFKQFVAHGDVMAARMAMQALQVGIHDIRCKLPVHQPKQAATFVKVHAEYLDKWITLVGFSQKYDRTGDSLSTEKAAAQDAADQKEQQLTSIEKRLQEDRAFLVAFQEIQTLTDRSKWTALHRETHMLLVAAKMEDFNIDLHNRRTVSLEKDLSILRHQMDSLRTCLSKKPDFSDPDLMNQYNDAMTQFLKELSESEQRMEEAINMVDKLNGALKQLDESMGHKLAMQASQDSAKNILEQIAEKQKNQVGMTEEEFAARMKALGLKTKEQLAAEQKAIQEMEKEKERPRLRAT